MNPIGLLALAISSGCGAALVWLLYGSRVAAETQAALPPAPNELDADREDWDSELAGLAKELADNREERAAKAAVRADTLRGIYLENLGLPAERPDEVSAR